MLEIIPLLFLFSMTGGISDTERCMALNIYHEARGESRLGQIAVAHVVLNRLRAKHRGARSICKVVYTPSQFSWTLGASKAPVSDKLLMPYYKIGYASRIGLTKDPTGGALHYYNPSTVASRPRWASAMTLSRTIGNHAFYIK